MNNLDFLEKYKNFRKIQKNTKIRSITMFWFKISFYQEKMFFVVRIEIDKRFLEACNSLFYVLLATKNNSPAKITLKENCLFKFCYF